jgi:glycosyltransferase involved in cell wall biosynthesis
MTSQFVSIICPLHNKEEFISETIKSVLAQSFENWELIIVENGSTDNGPDIVRKYSDSRISLVVSTKLGPGAARNYGLSLADGEWILFLDADDLLATNYLESRLKASLDASRPDIIVGGWEEFSTKDSGHILRRPAGESGGKLAIEEGAIAAAPWALHAALIRRAALSTDPWLEELDGLPSEDTAFWFALIRRSNIIFVPEYGALYRIPDQPTRNRPQDICSWLDAVNAVVLKNIAHLAVEGGEPSAAQNASVMRGFEAVYCRALDFDRDAAQKALLHADSWLARCDALSGSIMLRKILGISFFCRARKLVKIIPFV